MPGIERRPCGSLPDGTPVHEFTLDAGGPLSLSVLDLGGVVTALRCPDREGRVANVVLALASLHDHVLVDRNFGSLVGRYANRIAGGRFTLQGREHTLPRNDGPNTLHGGPAGFGARLWQATPLPPAGDGSVTLRLALVSEDGDQGFPGRLSVQVAYTLTPAGEWRLDYRATTDRATVVNLTHHTYWNLAGGGSAGGHRLTLAAQRYAPLDEAHIPGAFVPVAGTPFDFRAATLVDPRLREPHEQVQRGRGLDHCFLVDRQGPGLAFAARLEDPASGRVLEVHTTEPALQCYSGNFLDGRLRGRHGLLRQGDGLCLETQHVPDSPNRSDVPSTVLLPGEVFTSTTLHRLRAG